MNNLIRRIENDVQDRNSVAWKKLCDYVEKVAAKNRQEFSPLEALGPELFSQIHTLPETISKLKKVKKVWLYGSKLKRIPPEIGEMESLEYFDPYTSYDLHWFPFEITHCKKLKDSRVSTRALYGNFKNRMGFPDLTNNPVRYTGENVKCSVCGKAMTYEKTNQLWISIWVGTDVLPLLVNTCSTTCEQTLPNPPENYVPFAHKGGSSLKQPPDEYELFEMKMAQLELEQKDAAKQEEVAPLKSQEKAGAIKKPMQLIKLVRKIWDK